MSTKNVCIYLQYDGSRYDGWQKQGNTANTIQGKLEEMLGKLFEQDIELNGSGRTDAGVHAVMQVANFHVNTAYGPGKILELMNRYLPKDITVTDVKLADSRFHARLNAKSKTYRYRLSTGYARPVFGRQYVLYYPVDLDLDAMRKAAGYLIGEHDFSGFCGNRHLKKSGVRTIESITVSKETVMQGETEFEEVWLTFKGNGFLQNMVRIMTGTLIEIGEGKRAPEDVKKVLETCDRDCAGPMAPPHGLTLWKVEY